MIDKLSDKNEFVEKVVRVNRVAKVVKGGRRFSFSALVVVGNGQGKVGLGLGKASEVTEAIRKAVSLALRYMVHVNIEEGSVPHEILGRFGAGKVLIKPAGKGHGIIASAPVRAVMEAVGISDITVKCLGSKNPHNLVRSTLNGLYGLRSFDDVARMRNKEISHIKNI